MNRKTILAASCGVILLAGVLRPAPAEAQHYRRYPRSVFSAHIGYYSPWYYGYYWSPWYPYGPWPRWYGPWPRYYVTDNAGAARLQVVPRETQVYVDGYMVGIVDDFDGAFQRLRLPPGGHEIILRLEGHRNASHRLYFQPGTTITLRHRMEPLPPGAPPEPVPRPDPSAAAAQPRDRMAPRPPEWPDAPEPRDAPEPAQRPGAPEPPRMPYPGEDRTAGTRFGAIAVRVEPPDAEVIVNGTPWHGPAGEDGAIVIHVPQGTHRIEVRKAGFEPFVTDVEVRGGATTPVNVLLSKD